MASGSLRCLVIASCFVVLAADAGARQGESQRPAARPATAGVFDYYVLSLSWSPSHCLAHEEDAEQCARRNGSGFVLHGLWPQYAGGGYPQDCATQARLTAEAIEYGKTVFPSHTLIDHEWEKHGACSGLDALDYFKAAEQAKINVSVPASLDNPPESRSMVAEAIAAEFWTANPNMPSSALAVVCGGRQVSEVRFCLDKNLSPVTCGKGVKSSCPRGQIRVPAAR